MALPTIRLTKKLLHNPFSNFSINAIFKLLGFGGAIETIAISGSVSNQTRTSLINGVGLSLTLDDGEIEGIRKTITALSSGSATVTPDTLFGGGSLVLSSSQTVELEWHDSGGWHLLYSTTASSSGSNVDLNFSDGTRPLASSVPSGYRIFNTSDNAPNWSNGTNWHDALGNLT